MDNVIYIDKTVRQTHLLLRDSSVDFVENIVQHFQHDSPMAFNSEVVGKEISINGFTYDEDGNYVNVVIKAKGNFELNIITEPV